MNKSTDKLILSVGTHFLSLLIFMYVVGSHVINIITPQQTFIDPRIFDSSYLKIIITIGFLTACSGIIWGILEGEFSFIPLTSVRWKDRIMYLTSTLFFAFFYAGNNSPFKFIDKLTFIISFIVFLITLPSIVIYFSEFKFSYYGLLFKKIHWLKKQDINHKKVPSLKRNTRLLFVLGAIMFLSSLIMVVNFTMGYLNGQTPKEIALRRSFYIKSITPQKLIHAQPALLKGYNFDFGGDPKIFRVMTPIGQIPEVKKWDKTVIEFVVPLFLKNGDNTVWIEKPGAGEGKEQFIKSNIIHFTILPRFSFNPTDTDNLPNKIIKKIKKIILYKFHGLSFYLF